MKFDRLVESLNRFYIISGPGPRSPKGYFLWGIRIVGAVFSAFYLYTSWFGIISTESHLGIFFMVSLALTFLVYPKGRKAAGHRPEVLDFVFAGLIVVAMIYWMHQYEFLINQLGWEPRTRDTILGAIVILLSLEATRRTTGLIIPLVCVLFLLYAYLGPHLPGLLRHDGFPIWRIIEYNFVTTEGMIGMICNILASYILIFVIFGAFLERSGLGALFIDTALAATGHRTGGPGLTACFASGLMGMVSGSPVANVVTTGAFTIPLMKRVGYRPHFAGAVEAAASTGGQYMPPIMGAAAFILAEFTETPYIHVVKISILPALLYFGSVATMIYLEAKKNHLVGLPRQDLPSLKGVMKRSYQFLPVPLIIILMLKGFSPFYSAVWAILATVVLSWFRKDTRMGPREIFGALAAGARNSLAVGSLVGALGIILGTSLLTGLPSRLSEVLTQFSGGILPLVVLLLILAGYIIGMGLPATPSYLILSLFGVPALVKLGVPALTSHLIVFWVAVNSVVTPPVALAAMAAAAIAQAEPYKTAFQSTKLASWLYLMPFLFLYTPILLNGPPGAVVESVVTASAGMIAWGAAMQGYLSRQTSAVERLCLFASALTLLYAGIWTDIFGITLLAGVIVNQKYGLYSFVGAGKLKNIRSR
jgi:TRAP transporter 4TM/12TM fusion protein